MTTFAADSSATRMLLRGSAMPPVLRTAAQETGRLGAMVAGYGALIGLFALAAVSLWGNLPSAVADARLAAGFGAMDGPVQLRGSL